MPRRMPSRMKKKEFMPLHESIGISLGAVTPKVVGAIAKKVKEVPGKIGKTIKKKWDINQAYRNKNKYGPNDYKQPWK